MGGILSPLETQERLQGLGPVTKASIDKVATRKLAKLGRTTPLGSIKCARVFPVSQQEREQGILDRIAAVLFLAIRFQTQKNNSNVKFFNNYLGLFRGIKSLLTSQNSSQHFASQSTIPRLQCFAIKTNVLTLYLLSRAARKRVIKKCRRLDL